MSMVLVSRNESSRLPRGRLLVVVVAAAVVLSGLMAATPVQAQDANTALLLQRLDRLERDLSTLQRQVYRGDEPPPAIPAQSAASAGQGPQPLPGDVAGRLQVRMGELERLVQDLTGRVEESQFETRRVAQRLDQLVSDIDFRLSRLEQAAGLTAAGPADPGAPADGGQARPMGPDEVNALTQGDAAAAPTGGQGVLGYMRSDGTAAPLPTMPGGPTPLTQPGAPAEAAAVLPPDAPAEEQYRHAFSLLRKGDFPAAEQALAAFLRQHPDHELAGNAQYWLGESFYVRGDLQKAAVAFLDGYRTYPKSGKGPDNLLKLGMTVGQLGQKEQACAALEKLGLEYPQASDAIKRRAVAERQKLGCP